MSDDGDKKKERPALVLALELGAELVLAGLLLLWGVLTDDDE